MAINHVEDVIHSSGHGSYSSGHGSHSSGGTHSNGTTGCDPTDTIDTTVIEPEVTEITATDVPNILTPESNEQVFVDTAMDATVSIPVKSK